MNTYKFDAFNNAAFGWTVFEDRLVMSRCIIFMGTIKEYSIFTLVHGFHYYCYISPLFNVKVTVEVEVARGCNSEICVWLNFKTAIL